MIAEPILKEQSIIMLAQNGDMDAMEELLEQNKRLIYKILNKNGIYADNNDFEDIFQESNIRMMEAIYRFNINKNTELSTYCYSVIDGWVKHFIRTNNKVKYTRKSVEISERVKSKIDEGYTIEEISEEMGVKRENILEALNFKKGYTYLDENIDEDGDMKLEIEDYTVTESFVEIEYSIDIKNILNDGEFEIFDMLYNRGLTKSEIADICGCKKQTMNKKINRIHEKLKKYYE